MRVANLFIMVEGTRLACRSLGAPGGVPLVMLNHRGAVLDDVVPRNVDALAARHHVILIVSRGIGLRDGMACCRIGEAL